MPKKRFRLTPHLRGQIISGIRAGGYPHVAAEATNVPKDVFDSWLELGAQPDARDPYLSFAKDVQNAQAQARLTAEITVFKDDPKVWLEHGPGRETEGRPGWSVAVKPMEGAAEKRNVLLDPELMQLFRTLMEIMTPYPEARVKVAQALLDVGLPPPIAA